MPWGHRRGYRYSSTLSLTLALDGVRSTPRSRLFTPGEGPLYPLYRKRGGASGLLWTGAENLVTTEVPWQAAISTALYREPACQLSEHYLFRGKLREPRCGTRAIGLYFNTGHGNDNHTPEGMTASSRRILFGKYTINIQQLKTGILFSSHRWS
jgi:hypothetical protein